MNFGKKILRATKLTVSLPVLYVLNVPVPVKAFTGEGEPTRGARSLGAIRLYSLEDGGVDCAPRGEDVEQIVERRSVPQLH